jgi:integrase
MQKMLDHLRDDSGSVQSARTVFYVVSAFCKHYHVDPDTLVTLPREEIEELIRKYTSLLLQQSRTRGGSARYPNTVLTCLKIFFSSNGFSKDDGKALRLKSYRQPPRTFNRRECVPSVQEALLMADRAGSKRDRAIILTLWTTGLRNSAIRALQVGDVLSQLGQGEKILSIEIDSTWNNRVPGACKNRIPYRTFTAEITTEAIKSMLKERELRFSSYLPGEPLFVSNYNQIGRCQRRTKRLTARELQLIIKKAARAADIADWKLVYVHTMRKVFERVLRSRLLDGGQLDIKTQEFFMGHVLPGSQDHYYDRSDVQKLRDDYAKLVFDERSIPKDTNLEIARKLAGILGIDWSKAKIEKEKQLGRALTNEEEQENLDCEIKAALQGRGEDRIISPNELDEHITSGNWTFVCVLPDGRIVIRKKSAWTGQSSTT